MGVFMGLVRNCLGQVCCVMLGITTSSLSWAKAAPVEQQSTFRVAASQERLSSFLDGTLIDDERAWVQHGSMPPKASGRTSLSIDWVSGKQSGWGMGGFVESAIWVDGATGSVAALDFANNQRVAQKNASYPFAVETQKYRRWGVSIGKRLPVGVFAGSSSQVWWRAKGFAIDEYRWSKADGTLTESVTGELGLQAQVEQQQLGGSSPFVTPKKSLGYGFGFDFGMEGEIAESIQWQVALEDIGPNIKLSHVLSNSTQYNTNNASYDANGYIQYAPMTSGQYRDTSVSFQIEPRLSFSGRWAAHPGLAWFGGISHQKPFNQAHLGAETTFFGGNQLKTTLHAGSGGLPVSVGLSWRYRGLALHWRGNALSPSKARIWSLSSELSF
jgi:hypothetical protein